MRNGLGRNSKNRMKDYGGRKKNGNYIERRAELFYEGTRFVDLVRWGEGYSTLKDVGKVTPKFYGYTNGINSTPQSKDEWKVEYTETIGEGFVENKNELFPIPHVERSNNPNLEQNPGW